MSIATCYKVNMEQKFKFNAVIEYLFSRIKGLSQKKLADSTGLKQPEISMIKTGERPGTHDQREKIRKFFGLSEKEVLVLGSSIENGIDPIGLPKTSFNQARILLKNYFTEVERNAGYLPINYKRKESLLLNEIENKTPNDQIILNHSRFSLALIKVAKRDWFRNTKKLADKAKIHIDVLNKILDNKTVTPPEKQRDLAEACGYTYEEFLKIGEEEERKIREQIYPDDDSVREPAEEALKNENQALKAEIEELKKALSTQSQDGGKVTPIVKEHMNVVPRFKYPEKGLLANKSLLVIEELDREFFFTEVAKLENKALELQEQKKTEMQEQEAAEDLNGTTGE